jgi:hypothetical protein
LNLSLQFFSVLSNQLEDLFAAAEKNVPISAGEVRAGMMYLDITYIASIVTKKYFT